jgi:hypothetical protein
MTFSPRRVLRALSAWSGRAFVALAMSVSVAFPVLAPMPGARAEPRQPPGSRVAIDVGAAFTPSDRFSGFVDKSSGASFVIIQMPASTYDEFQTLPDSKEALAQQGLSGTERAELKGREGTFIYLVGTQNTPAGAVAKFVLIFKEHDVTAMIVANVPQPAIDAGTYSREAVEKILATAMVRDTPAPAAELFRFRYLGPFKEAFNLAGTTKGYSISGTQPRPGENRLVKEPMLLVSPSIDNRTVDPQVVARRTFMRLGGMKEGQMDGEKGVTIGGLKGYQIIGEAADAGTGARIAIHLVLLAGEPFGYFAIVGTTPIADKDKIMPEIEKVIASFEPVK